MNIEKELHFLKTKASEYAAAKGDAERLREFRKSKKALLIIEAEKHGRKTQQERESYAYSHPEYIALLDGIGAAIEKSEYLRMMVKAAELQIESKRMIEMRAMAEMKLR